MSEDARRQLARLQAQLVRALVEGDDAPTDFDRQRLTAAAEALLSKRARAVAHAWPRLARDLGDDFAARFASYARARPLSHDGSPLADGRAFIRWLERAGPLSDDARLEAFAFDARYRIGKDRITRRRGPCVRVLRLRATGRLVVLLRLPLLGERWL